MKKLTLVILSTLIMLLMTGSAFAAALADDLLADKTEYNIGDTVCYTIKLTAYDGDLTDVSVYLYVPTTVGTGTCDGVDAEPGGIPIVGPVTLLDGVPLIIDCNDNANLAYVVQAGDLTDSDGALLTAKLATEATDAGEPDCDQETRTVTILPPQPDIEIIKSANPTEICEGDPCAVTYTYEVTTGTGDVALEDVVVTDDTCGGGLPLVLSSGDDNTDGILDIGETWIYECIVAVPVTTTNTAIAEGNDVLAGTHVSDNDQATVTVYIAPGVSVDPAQAEICEGSEQQFCAIVTGGQAPYSYAWEKDGSPIGGDTACITATEAGEYCVKVTDENGCQNEACATLSIIESPDCTINGPTSVCVGDTGIEYCSVAMADSYSWSIVGDGTIVGPNDGQCVLVDAGIEGSFTLSLEVCAENAVVCCSNCELNVTAAQCGGEGCTPGFWKNNADKKEANAWEGHLPEDSFSSVFGRVIEVRTGGKKTNTVSDPTLLQALEASGGGINALARHAVAALLNISSGCVEYPYGSEAELIADVQDAIDSDEDAIQALHVQLAMYNEAGCPINQQGECNDD